MGLALKLYEQLTEAPDDMTRFKLVANTIDELEQLWPKADEVATGGDVREAELRLQKEIEQLRADTQAGDLNLRKEIEQLRGDLQKDIEQLRGDLQKDIEQLRADTQAGDLTLRKEIEQLRGDLQKDIEQLRADTQAGDLTLRKEIEQVRVEVKATEASLRTTMHRQTLWIIGAIGAVVGFVRLLEWFTGS